MWQLGNVNPERLEVFKRGLTDLGYIESKNIKIDYREAVLDGEYPRVMAELVDGKVSIILAANVAAAVAAAKATTTIPIVMLAVNDPVGLGLVKSLQHPGTNVTGTTAYAPQLIGPRPWCSAVAARLAMPVLPLRGARRLRT
jgi:putative ABC transport system substrate-binding protein